MGPFLYGGGDYEKILGMYRRYWQQFSKYWGYFILVTIGSSFIIGQVVIPGLTWLVQKMMELANIPYLSYTNIVSVIIGHPVVAVGLLIILIITLLAAYLQFTIWMAIVANIRAQQNVSIWQLIVERIKDLRRVRFTTMLVTIAYLIVVVPFSKTIFQSELLSKITIPVFILDDMWNSATIWVPIVTFTLLAVFLSIRLITFLPGSINRH